MRGFLTALVPATFRLSSRLPGHEVCLYSAMNWKMLFSLCLVCCTCRFLQGHPMRPLRTKSGSSFHAGFQLIGFEKSALKKKNHFPPKSKGKKWSMSSSKLDSNGLEIQHRPAVLWAADLMWLGFPWANLVWIQLGLYSWKLWLQLFLWVGIHNIFHLCSFLGV